MGKSLPKIMMKVADSLNSKDARISEKFTFLEKSQYWEKEKLLKYQNDQLSILIDHSYRNVPIFHSICKKHNIRPGDIRTRKDLVKLPILTKDDLRSHLEEYTVPELKENAINYRTSGSTGEPLSFYIDYNMLSWTSAAKYRGWSWAGYKLGDRSATLWGSLLDIKKSKTMKGRLRNMAKNNLMFNAFDMTEDILMEYAKKMVKFKPQFIRTYGSSAYVFAKFIKENNIKGIEPKAILTTGENLYPHMRKEIESVFNCNVFDGYASRETSLIAFECEMHNGYHISDENSIVEFVDKNGENVSPGESGDIIITDLHNKVMPWIRYRIEDRGTPTDEKCNCGRALTLIKSLQGRTLDVLTTPNGGHIGGPGLSVVMGELNNIKQAQIVQKSHAEYVFNLVIDERYTEDDGEYLISKMRLYFGNEADLKIKFVDKIPTTPSGKVRFIVSEIAK